MVQRDAGFSAPLRGITQYSGAHFPLNQAGHPPHATPPSRCAAELKGSIKLSSEIIKWL